ncbi:hypothetical protein L0P54_11640 [Anaerosalibacter bizertensis]|uniref:Uncharacterized protein n=1 Tax=Anaerosalibacter bizertensis TaxID=932217 RepID=A0A9Q4AED3_9FIRM|nr:hypothetical protein [Anaerosalibacter bizertensis]MBV1819652.1 hypothetical protein [Bacteroidales bacterium MSK.15.36]MCB5560301.1 hypothetical protein [Anaerosalibacter bizertensis]MCG4565889.1 hypothetical protein [Anaerosalibacter bizertensis]MCG4583638.1 hypothetical protein [Anaerosalibacter bizertensis]
MINSINNSTFLNSINNYQSKTSTTNKNEIDEVEFSNHLTSVDKVERKKGLEELMQKLLNNEFEDSKNQKEAISKYYNLNDKDEFFRQFANDFDMNNMNSKELVLLECIIHHADFIDFDDKVGHELEICAIGAMLRLDATDLAGITNEKEAWDYRGNIPRLLNRLYNASELEDKVSILKLIRMVEEIQSFRVR